MRIRGLGRLQEQLAKLRGQLQPGPIVLLYHRVTNLLQDPSLLAVTPDHFEEHLLVLRQHYRTVSLSDLVDRVAHNGRVDPVVAITFDDGYADNAEVALPLLMKHEVPATFYLASGFVGSVREQLQDELERLLLLSAQCPKQLRLTVDGRIFGWNTPTPETERTLAASIPGWNRESKNDPTPRHRAYRELCDLLRAAPPAERELAIKQARSKCGESALARSTHYAMSWDQVSEIAACQMAEIGAHTGNHAYLSALPLEAQRAEISESKQSIEEHIGRPVTSFAYPYGTRESYTKETMRLLKELGFAYACSNFRSRIDHRTDLFQIPRFVVRNWDGDTFLRQVRKALL